MTTPNDIQSGGVAAGYSGAVLVAPPISVVGLRGATVAETFIGHSELADGYAYMCDGATQVQVVKKPPGQEVVVAPRTSRYTSTTEGSAVI